MAGGRRHSFQPYVHGNQRQAIHPLVNPSPPTGRWTYDQRGNTSSQPRPDKSGPPCHGGLNLAQTSGWPRPIPACWPRAGPTAVRFASLASARPGSLPARSLTLAFGPLAGIFDLGLTQGQTQVSNPSGWCGQTKPFPGLDLSADFRYGAWTLAETTKFYLGGGGWAVPLYVLIIPPWGPAARHGKLRDLSVSVRVGVLPRARIV